MRQKQNDNKVISITSLNFVFLMFIFLIILILLKFTYLALATNVNGINLQEFVKNRNTRKKTLIATRGTIYDTLNNPLAQNINIYKLIAYLDPKRSANTDQIYHVKNKETTAKSLSTVIDMPEVKILSILNKKAYQVEFGAAGSSLTELQKEAIEKLSLPGIDFVPSYKRYYPNGNYLSYVLGYAKTNEKNTIVGEIGLESYYNKQLTGKNGFLQYEKDRNGYKIAGTKEIKREPIDGNDIYLTIDSNIQLFLERTIKKQVKIGDPDTMFMAIMEAKTGKILGVSSEPSFNPNERDIKDYMNPLVSSQYEPGSTLKALTYLSVIDKGVYNGNETFKSGYKQVGPDKVWDWNDTGWGTINFDQGFMLSSNVGIATLIDKYLSRKELHDFYGQLGFGKTTNFTLPGEEDGKINFKYPLEVMNAGFGQGMTVTPVQMLQAFTAISNDGVILKPYIVDKIINPNNKKIVYKGKKTELGKIARKTSVDVVKDLMEKVVNCGDKNKCTGTNYYIKGLNIIGKTGTAQIAGPGGKGYLKGDVNTIKSFVGIFPKENPEYLIYVVVKRPHTGATMVSDAFKEVLEDLIKYKNLTTMNTKKIEVKSYVPSYLNKSVVDVKNDLIAKGLVPIVIGQGVKVINQSLMYENALKLSKIFIITEGALQMPAIKGYSYNDVITMARLLGLRVKTNGSGYVTKQSISENANITKGMTLTIDLTPRL